MTRTVILGAGFGGLTCAAELARLAPDDHEIVLVDDRGHVVLGLAKLQILDGRRTPDDVRHDTIGIERLGVKRLRARATRIDPATRRVETTAGPLDADHLVLAMGASFAPERVPGFDGAALNLYSVDGIARLRDALATFDGGDVLFLVTALPFKCPPAPYEAAMLAKAFLASRGIDARVTVASPEPHPLPVAGPECGATVTEWARERGVDILPGRKVARIDAVAKVVRFEDGSERRYDLLAAVPPHVAPRVLAEAKLTDASGFVPVDAATLRTAHENVYAIGDNNVVKLANGKPLVKAGVMAEGEGRVVARNIASAVRAEAPGARFDGKGGCWLELGGGLAVEVEGDFYRPDGPLVVAKPPSRKSLEAKEAFERDRIREWLGA